MDKIDRFVEKYLLSADFIQTFCDENIFTDPEFCLDFGLTYYAQDYLITMFQDEIVELVIKDFDWDITADFTDWEKMYLFKYLVDEIESPSMMEDYATAYAENNTGHLETEYITSTTHKLIEKLNLDIHEKIVEYCLEVDKDNLIYVSRHIAIQKIKRSQIYNFGLGLKLSIKNCGVELTG
jgi:hypothetical protein